jgi:hypothetical protein
MAQMKFVPPTKNRRDYIPSMSFVPCLNRIPLIQLRDLAAYPGWENLNSGQYNFLEFRVGLQEAGLNGQLKFWGRPDKQMFPDSGRPAPLCEIPKGHWSEFEIEILGLALAVDNMNARTYQKGGGKRMGYVDLHTESSAAWQWLRNDVNNYKGQFR